MLAFMFTVRNHSFKNLFMLLFLLKVENSSCQRSVHARIYGQGRKPFMPKICSCII
jgi:hypothetical protein